MTIIKRDFITLRNEVGILTEIWNHQTLNLEERATEYLENVIEYDTDALSKRMKKYYDNL